MRLELLLGAPLREGHLQSLSFHASHPKAPQLLLEEGGGEGVAA